MTAPSGPQGGDLIGEVGTAPPGTPAVTPTAQPPAPRQLDQRALSQLRQSLIDPMVQALNAVNERMNAIEQRLGGGQPGAGMSGDGGPAGRPKSFLEQFVEDDSGSVIDKRIDERLQAQMKPYMTVLLTDRQQDAIGRQRARFDSRYGDGAWDNVIWPKVEKQLNESPEHLRASNDYVQALVNSVKGDDTIEDQLTGMREKHMKSQADASRLRPAAFVGAGRPPRIGGEELPVTEEDRTVLSSLQREGINWSERDFQRARTLPKEFNARMEALAKISGQRPDQPTAQPAAPAKAPGGLPLPPASVAAQQGL